MQKFGGKWTDDKLDRLRKYLSAYTTIFKQSHNASHFKNTYLDAFAGNGYRNPKSNHTVQTIGLFGTTNINSQFFSKGKRHY